MQSKKRVSKHSGIIEKYTNTGTSRYTHEDTQISWSPNLFSIFELDANEYLACAEWEVSCFSEHTKKLIQRRIEIGEKNLESFDIRLPFKSVTGQDKWIRCCCEFIHEDNNVIERITIFQDITQSVNLAEHNNYYQERIELALTSSRAGTWDYQVVTNELYWDESMCTLFEVQRPTQSMKFSSWMEYVHPNSKDLFIDSFNDALRFQEPDSLLSFVFETLTPLGNTKFIKLSAKFYSDIHAKAIRVVGTCIDVTENEVKTNKIIEQATIAQKNAIIAQDASEARARFIANVSHEIRTPMNSIMGALQILNNYNFNADLKQLIVMASDSAGDLLDVINGVLDLSKIDAEKMSIETIDIDVRHLVNNTISHFKSAIKNGVALQVKYDEKLNNHRMGDPIRFNQVINNLISNAIKFTHSGRVDVTINGNDEHICIEVKDTGIGIKPENLEIIFEPFKQADESTTREFGGTGLGLAISRKLAKLMGGDISVSSEYGEGTTFTFDVPLPVTENHVSAVGMAPLSSNIPNLSEHHILYAEDNPASVNIVKQLLHPTKAMVTIATNGKSALDMYRKSNEITIVILDIQMPMMNGMEVCERIRMENKHIPIIALTANVMIEDQKKYFNIGFSQIIEKPIKFDRFYETLNKV